MTTIDKNEFKRLIQQAETITDVDVLCVYWLEIMAGGYGRDGEIARALLDQVRVLLKVNG